LQFKRLPRHFAVEAFGDAVVAAQAPDEGNLIGPS
jgi:hypothetical protein